MKKRAWICAIGTLSVVLSILLVGWYYSPVQVETIDRMAYCACGYAEVKFDAGNIIMLHYPHDTVKPGETIGRYRLLGPRQIELTIHFGDKTHVEVFRFDHLGIINTPPSLFEYLAVVGDSPKNRIYFFSQRIRDWFRSL